MNTDDLVQSIYIGTFGAERYWRDNNLAVLPFLKDNEAENIIGTLDELQFVFCNNDILFTRHQLERIQIDYLNTIGYNFNNLYLYENDREQKFSSENICKILINHKQSNYFPSLKKNVEFAPYAIDEYSRQFCDVYKINCEIPGFDVVRKVNSKHFSFEILKSIYPIYNGEYIDSTDSLLITGKKLLENAGSFLLKDIFGVSGNGNILIESENRLNTIYNYLLRQELVGKYVQFIAEPLYKKDIDFSCQLDIFANGEIVYNSIQVMHNKGFAFSGIEAADQNFYNHLEKSGYFNYIEKIVETVYKEGYFGPLCIDSMQLLDSSIIPLIEINARKSMGLINTLFKKKHKGCSNTFLITYSLGIPSIVTYEMFLDTLRSHNILFYPNKEYGIVPLTSKAFSINKNNLSQTYRGRIYLGFIYDNANTKNHLILELEKVFSVLNIQS